MCASLLVHRADLPILPYLSEDKFLPEITLNTDISLSIALYSHKYKNEHFDLSCKNGKIVNIKDFFLINNLYLKEIVRFHYKLVFVSCPEIQFLETISTVPLIL